MARRLASTIALLACLTLAGPYDSRPVPSDAALEREVFALVNRHRIAHRLPELTYDPRIAREARRHSAAMADGLRSVGHRGFDDRTTQLRRIMPAGSVAENVALNRGYRRPAEQAMRGWLDSYGHRENIEGRYHTTGVGVVRNGDGEIYFTQIFVAWRAH